MKLQWIKSLVTLVLFLVSVQVVAQPIVIAGGEIPWPLAIQYKITPENSRGLWKLEQEQGMRYFNVEILDQVEDTTFFRVSELDPVTFKVLSWGEGFFKDGKSEKTIATEFWSTYLDGNIPVSADVGRYLYMYPNGDITETPYMLRLVEVRTLMGSSLGMSIYPYASIGSKEHALGARVQADPLECRINEVQDPEVLDSLTCDMPIEDAESGKSEEDELRL